MAVRNRRLLLAYRAWLVAGLGAEELVAVEELQDGVGDPDSMLRPAAAMPRQTCCQLTQTTPVRGGGPGGRGGRPEVGDRCGRGVQEPVGRSGHGERLVRSAVVVLGDPGVELGLRVSRSGEVRSVRNSVRSARWNRSTLPVVVGERGWGEPGG